MNSYYDSRIMFLQEILIDLKFIELKLKEEEIKIIKIVENLINDKIEEITEEMITYPIN
jgi:hypothetical protein